MNAYYAATEEMPAYGGSFTEGIVGQPTFINPLLSSGSDADESVIALLFPRLGNFIETYAVSPDRKTVSVSIKKGVMWDDGAPLTADDIVFTIETAQDILVRSPQSGPWQGVIAEKINDDETRFTLREPSTFFEKTLRALRVVPRHIFGAIPAANLRLSTYNLEPVGAGPWKFAGMKTERNGFITALYLAPNPRYTGTRPFIANFTLRFYHNEDAVLAAFNAKEIDGWGGIDAKKTDQLLVKHRLASISLPRYYALFFNPNTHPALKEKEVRQALSSAIDRTKLVRDVFNGYAATATGPLTPRTEGYDANAQKAGEETSAEYAQNILEKNGWLINPEDGIRYKTINRNRIKLTFTAYVPDLPFLTEAMEIIKDGWKKIGVEVKTIAMTAEDIQKGPIKTRNYEMIVFGNVLKENPDIGAFWHSSQKFYPGLNLAMYENKAVDTILANLHTAETPNTTQLKKLQELIHEDAPAAFLMNPNYLYTLPHNLHGFNPEELISPEDRLANTDAWYIRTQRQFKK